MDILCEICNEDWTSYGVEHGDMAKWEAKLFRKGSGCPECEGEMPKGADKDDHQDRAARLAFFNHPEEGEEIILRMAAGTVPPKWERPPDPLIQACSCCSLELKRDNDDEELYWKNWGTRFHTEDPTKDFFADWCGESDVCENCQISCSDCSAQLLDDDRDIYEGRVVHHRDDHYGREPLCIDCLSVREMEEEEENLSSRMSNVANDWVWMKKGEEVDEGLVHDELMDAYGKGLLNRDSEEDDMVECLIKLKYAQEED